MQNKSGKTNEVVLEKYFPTASETVFREVFDLYGLLDRRGKILFLRGVAFDLTNTKPELLFGQRFSETVFWQSSENTARVLKKAFKHTVGTGVAGIVLDFRINRDEKRPMAIKFKLLGGNDGPIRVTGQFIDSFITPTVTDGADHEELIHAADLAEIGLWHWDLSEDRVYSTPRCNDIFELSAYESLTSRSFLKIVHRDDRSPLEEILSDSRERGSKFDTEFRVVYSDGATEWISVVGKTIMGNDDPPRMLGVVRKITEQKLAADDLANIYDREKKARDEAVEANRAKDLFLAFVSHELRAPLNAILGWSRILLTKEVDAETRRNALETIERSARAQNKLIDDLVDSARVASGRLRLEYRPINLYEVVRGSFEAQKPTAEIRGIEYDFQAVTRNINIIGDSARLQQVFGNLISNAIKFTPAGGRVSVEITIRENTALVSITDTGRGISSDSLPTIFRQFAQGDTEDEKTSAGLGLGLSIAKILTERHGGSIKGESGGLGQGSKFTVTLPLTNSAASESNSDVTDVTAEGSEALFGMKILIIDDDPDSLNVLRHFLEQGGAKVVSANRAEAAVEIIRNCGDDLPDLIISDLAMPEEDGYAMIARIRQLPESEGGNIPAIALSSFVMPESKAKASEAGFNSYFTKPFYPDLLSKGIIELINGGISPKL